MSLYYLDTSAALKLLSRESHSQAFGQFYDGAAGAVWISSALLRLELVRAVRRGNPRLIPAARELLEAFDFVHIDDGVVEAAMNEPEPLLRSLDALHLATARTLGPDLDGLATYDARLEVAARNAGISVISPREPPARQA